MAFRCQGKTIPIDRNKLLHWIITPRRSVKTSEFNRSATKGNHIGVK